MDNSEALPSSYLIAHLDGETTHTTRAGNEHLAHETLVAAHVAIERELVTIAARFHSRGLHHVITQ